ncbi:putative ankyrin repeat protein RF_0381 isoform X1 [Saccostrea echinata]|uniref:putative ankyrin repeat protein RF_0381 isoform X1 n=1 Tax=Saccostrea echinata TaxID=191078 RepID=UPI002A809371|nr:putative ankyrin repeat protein RF_0381 isoform X1 [Saccostrea echinata]
MRRSYSNLHDIVDNLRFGSEKYFQTFIEKKGDLNLSDGYGRTLLMWSVLDGKTQRVQALIDAGCRLNLGDRNKDTALMHAVQTSNIEITQVLVLHGAIINTINEENSTPLSEAVQQNNLQMVKLLLLYGADSNYICGHRHLQNIRTALTTAIENDQEEIICAILSARQTNVSLHLSVCIQSHNLGTFQFLLAHGADVFYSGVEGSIGETILNEYLNGHLQAEKFLISLFKENGFCTSISKKNDIMKCLIHLQKQCTYSKTKEKLMPIILKYLLPLGIIPDATIKSKISMYAPDTRGPLPIPCLQKLCRTAIREAMCFGISLKTDKLPLPVRLKNFILFDEIGFKR